MSGKQTHVQKQVVEIAPDQRSKISRRPYREDRVDRRIHFVTKDCALRSKTTKDGRTVCQLVRYVQVETEVDLNGRKVVNTENRADPGAWIDVLSVDAEKLHQHILLLQHKAKEELGLIKKEVESFTHQPFKDYPFNIAKIVLDGVKEAEIPKEPKPPKRRKERRQKRDHKKPQQQHDPQRMFGFCSVRDRVSHLLMCESAYLNALRCIRR